jgi:hypothetical protein
MTTTAAPMRRARAMKTAAALVTLEAFMRVTVPFTRVA